MSRTPTRVSVVPGRGGFKCDGELSDVVVMWHRGRVSGGRAEAWGAALDHLKTNRGLVARIAGVLLGSVVVINLPFFPGIAYLRGLETGILVVTFLWIVSWFAWVTSGLAFRIQGTFAEDAVTAQFRDSKAVLGVIAGLRFGKSDVDQVVITRAGITAVETKWHARPPSDRTLEAAADQAGAGARSLRNTLPSLKTTGLPSQLVTAALVVCGPGGRSVPSCTVTTGLGPVDVVCVADLDKWLAKRDRGVVGRDFAKQIGEELDQLARSRDKAAVTAGPLLRWIARSH
jgi:hypothetical protein